MRRLTAGLVIAFFIPALALAHSGAGGVVKERMDGMKEIANAVEAIAKIMKGETSFDLHAVKQAAKKIRIHAADMQRLFPQDSIEKPSEALPVIWQDWDEFTDIAKSLKSQAIELENSQIKPEMLPASLSSIAGTCRDCHSKFRLKK